MYTRIRNELTGNSPGFFGRRKISEMISLHRIIDSIISDPYLCAQASEELQVIWQFDERNKKLSTET